MRAYATAVVALRFLIVPAWIAAAVLATTKLPGLQQSGGALADLVPADTAAGRAEQRALRLFRFPVTSDTLVVQRDAGGLGAAEQARVALRARRLAARGYPELHEIVFALPVTNTLGLFPGSRESGTTAVTSLFFDADYSLETKTRLARDFERHVRGDDLVGTTGPAPARLDQYHAIQDALPYVTLATVLLIGLLVGLNFRAVAAPLVVLFAAGIGYAVNVRALGWFAQRWDVSIPQETEPLLVVLLLGVVTDYSIFYLSAHRRRLAQGDGAGDAAREATASVTPIVLAAGLIVAASAAALLVARTDFLRAFGPGLALTALVSVAVAVTLVPATLALLGRRAYWPGAPRAEALDEPSGPARRPWRERIAYWATARPLAAVIGLLVVAGLVAAGTGLARTQLGLGLLSGLPRDTETRRAADAAGQGFAPGILSPTTLLLEQPGITRRRAQLARLETLLAGQDGVAGVLGPREQVLAEEHGVVLSEDGNAARIVLVLDRGPFSAAGVDVLERVRDRLPALQRTAGLPAARASFAGGTALAAETIDGVVGDLWRVALVALAVDFVLLALFLRSLVAPLFLLGASVLSLAAALGLATYVFQGWLGYGELTYYVPFATAILLVALGSDYNVFVAGRIWEEARRRPLREAVAVAAPRAARAITVAGLVLALSFAALAIVPLRAFREFAFVMSAGVLIDAFVVRSFLVPALVSLFGTASAWPGRRFRTRVSTERV